MHINMKISYQYAYQYENMHINMKLRVIYNMHRKSGNLNDAVTFLFLIIECSKWHDVANNIFYELNKNKKYELIRTLLTARLLTPKCG